MQYTELHSLNRTTLDINDHLIVSIVQKCLNVEKMVQTIDCSAYNFKQINDLFMYACRNKMIFTCQILRDKTTLFFDQISFF